MHKYHLVDKSYGPGIISIHIGCSLINLTELNKGHVKGTLGIILSIVITLLIMKLGTRDIIRESTGNGSHSTTVTKGLLIGIVVFIISETMLFIGVFGGYLHNYFNPSILLGVKWPSSNIDWLDPYEIPMVNTILLLSSASAVTITHHSLSTKRGGEKYKTGSIYLMISILLVTIFIYLQYIEYKNCSFDISDSTFASLFFMGTTLHGLHVIVALIGLTYTLIRMYKSEQWNQNHTHLLTSLWYFHFTDVVGLVLYSIFYLATFY